MNTQHTSGTWRYIKAANQNPDAEYGAFNIYSENVPCFSRVSFGKYLDIKSEAEAEANARLIAAAPELLEALKAVTEQLNVFSDEDVTNKNAIRTALKQSADAIQKATT